ncbi:MAG: helix-turn-helix domain-containing protein [Planctomycetaceae bacterium]|jgi:excisionase family DNA binding protein|nr:helix-turn-helix domain-containing protein [Planctomycetaceae bacterium]
MVKPAETEYYSLEKTAQVLSVTPAEVNRLREQNKLRAFRDGANWKFRKTEVDEYLVKIIRGRSRNDADDDGFDVAGKVADSVDSDVVDNIPLPDEKSLAEVGAKQDGGEFDLAVSADDDYRLSGEETSVLSLAELSGEKTPDVPRGLDALLPAQEDSSNLAVAGDSSSPLNVSEEGSSAEKSAADFVGSEDSSVQDKPGTEPLGLAMESVFSEIKPAENDFIAGEVTDNIPSQEDSNLALRGGGEDSSQVISLLKTDGSDSTEQVSFEAADEFDLTQGVSAEQSDNSESSSQVIAIEPGVSASGSRTEDDTFGGFDIGGAPMTDFDGIDTGGGTSEGTFSNAGGFDSAGGFAASTPQTNFAKVPEYQYTNGALTAIIIAAVLLVLPGMMLADIVAGMWSWHEPFILNSVLMNTIAGWFGLV